jgi:hypothetical protein
MLKIIFYLIQFTGVISSQNMPSEVFLDTTSINDKVEIHSKITNKFMGKDLKIDLKH